MAVRSEPRWFKSSYSGGSGTECVECARAHGCTLVRDSSRADGPVIGVRARAWQAFIEGLTAEA